MRKKVEHLHKMKECKKPFSKIKLIENLRNRTFSLDLWTF